MQSGACAHDNVHSQGMARNATLHLTQDSMVGSQPYCIEL